MNKTLRRALSITALAVTPVLVLATNASASPITVSYNCQAQTPVGPVSAPLDQDFEGTAPATVAPGATFTIVIDPAPNTVPSDAEGIPIKNVRQTGLRIPIPANTTYLDATLSGGSDVGTPTIAVADGVATISVPDALTGGAAFELPTVTLTLKAGDSGTIEGKLYGTSYENPGLTFIALASAPEGDFDVPVAGFPDPSPVLTTTTIG